MLAPDGIIFDARKSEADVIDLISVRTKISTFLRFI